uniref:Uncharacterized protein n=1 Tax=Anguilla anguilla TaxID=7936 RepID=A0A0E9PUG6_ANGAN
MQIKSAFVLLKRAFASVIIAV